MDAKEILNLTPQTPPQDNVAEQHNQETDVKTKLKAQVVDATITTKKNTDMKTLLFAVDTKTQETIISQSIKGSNKIIQIDKIKQSDNNELYKAALTLKEISKAPNFNINDFKAADKLCQKLFLSSRP